MRVDRNDNESLLRELVGGGRLDMELGAPFEQPPPFESGAIHWDRVRGMMLGLAIGDALGNTTEGLLPALRRQQHGEIRNYLPNRYAEGRAVGLPSDDSQLAFWTLEHLIDCGRLVPQTLAQAFASREIFGIGHSVRQFVAGMHAGRPWWKASARSAGNGALMRIAPITIPHLGTAGPGFWCDAALCAAITHNDRGSIGACVAFAGMLRHLLGCHRVPGPDWWVTRYVEVARTVEGESEYVPRGGTLRDSYRGSLWRLAKEQVPPRVARRESVLQAANAWHSGAYLLETLPTALFILARHGDDPEEAIVRAVNDSKDNDTVAAIVGAAVGALHGEDALPHRWRDGLLGRTAADDDGRVFGLLDRAQAQFNCKESGLEASEVVVRPRTGVPTKESDGAGILERAQGCLLGQLAGDALGSLVEFETPQAIRSTYPDGVRELADGGTWNTLAGQPTDDSEMALSLARTLVEHGRYDREEVRRAYVAWLESDPFDCGATIAAGLTGRSNPDSQANGALMRISPLGIFGTYRAPDKVIEWARKDAAITHPHGVCRQANALFVAAISFAIRSGGSPDDVYRHVRALADETAVQSELHDAVTGAAHSPPADYVRQQGWVLIAFRNALWQLLHASSMAAGVVDTVMRGGDTDTNGAICGALLGAVHGREAIPAQWVEKLLNCRPHVGRPGVRRPRPAVYWPVDALQLAERLLTLSAD